MPRIPKTKVIVLAAGVGSRFGAETKMWPKCLIPLGSAHHTLLSRYLETFEACKITDVTIVVGHLKQQIIDHCSRYDKKFNFKFIENPDYKFGSVISLYHAKDQLCDNVIIMDADVFFTPEVFVTLATSAKKNCFLIDKKKKSGGEEMMLMSKSGRPWTISKTVDKKLKSLGEATGILRLDKAHAKELAKILKDLVEAEKNILCEYEESYNRLLKKKRLSYLNVGKNFWTEMDFKDDWQNIITHLRGRKLPTRAGNPRSY